MVGLSTGTLPTRVNPGDRIFFLDFFFQNFQGTRTYARSVVLRVFRALEATSPNLLFACVQTHMRMECVGCVRPKLCPIDKIKKLKRRDKNKETKTEISKEIVKNNRPRRRPMRVRFFSPLPPVAA